MQNDFPLYHDILFLRLKPSANRELSDIKFKELLLSLPKEHFSFQPAYEVDFPKPLNAMRKYYFALIENEAIRYLNTINNIFSIPDSDAEKKFWIHNTLTKKLAQKLKETSKIITDNKFYFDLLQPLAKQKISDARTLDEAYILQYLKHTLIRLYIEIQETHEAYLSEDAITEEELHETFFTEPEPYKSLLVEAVKINLPKPASQFVAKADEPPFNANKSDFRGTKKGVLAYDAIIKDARRFSLFEEELYVNGYIDKDYNFKPDYGNKDDLAAISHILIKKGYFNKRIFPKNVELKPVEVRKFIDFRYNASVDKQFRNLNDKPDLIAAFIDSHYWVEKLPTS